MSHERLKALGATSFVADAADDFDKWSLAVGYLVTYSTGAVGTIVKVDIEPGSGALRIFVEFDRGASGHRHFKPQSFRNANLFSDLHPPSNPEELELVREQISIYGAWQDQERREEVEKLEKRRRAIDVENEKREWDEKRQRQWDEIAEKQRIASLQAQKELKEIVKKAQREEAAKTRAQRDEVERQQRQEEGASRHFAELKKRYLADANKDETPLSPLYPILLQIDVGEPLTNDEINWLKWRKLNGPLALHFEGLFSRSQDEWDLVQASSNWRDYGRPDRALIVTEVVSRMSELPNVLRAAILTTRGGAFCDMHDLTQAEACGLTAISYNENTHYAYNLMGRIYVDMKNPEKADKYFGIAQQKPSVKHSKEKEWREAIERAGLDERRVAAEYLVRKDPEQYSWAQSYVKGRNVT